MVFKYRCQITVETVYKMQCALETKGWLPGETLGKRLKVLSFVSVVPSARLDSP